MAVNALCQFSTSTHIFSAGCEDTVNKEALSSEPVTVYMCMCTRGSEGLFVTGTHVSKGQKPFSWVLPALFSLFPLPRGFGAPVTREQRGQGTPEWLTYLVQGCETILVTQIRADLVLQEVAYCKRKGQE